MKVDRIYSTLGFCGEMHVSIFKIVNHQNTPHLHKSPACSPNLPYTHFNHETHIHHLLPKSPSSLTHGSQRTTNPPMPSPPPSATSSSHAFYALSSHLNDPTSTSALEIEILPSALCPAGPPIIVRDGNCIGVPKKLLALAYTYAVVTLFGEGCTAEPTLVRLVQFSQLPALEDCVYAVQ